MGKIAVFMLIGIIVLFSFVMDAEGNGMDFCDLHILPEIV